MENKRKRKKRKKKLFKGFTLIELLAVIIILGVLMIIAIPSVTEYIQSSRKDAYVTTASQFVTGARNKVNSAEVTVYDVDATYYLPTSCISLEKGGVSPFGDIEEGYIVITYDGTGYDYYFTARDSANMGILLTSEDKLNNDLVQPGITELDTTVAIEGKEKIYIIEDCGSTVTTTDAVSVIPVNGDYEQKEIISMTVPYFGKEYVCQDLRGSNPVDVGVSIFLYENGDVASILNKENVSFEKANHKYENNKIINIEDNKSIASVSKNGKVIDFNDGDYGLDNLWWTCTMNQNSSPIVFEKAYTGIFEEDGDAAEASFVFYSDGSLKLSIAGEEDILFPASSFIFTYDKIYSANATMPAIDILNNGEQIKLDTMIFNLQK